MLTSSNKETLVADVRDVIVNAAKAATVSITGKEMRETDQRNVIDRAEDIAAAVVRRIVRAVVVGYDCPVLDCTIKQSGEKDRKVSVHLDVVTPEFDRNALSRSSGGHVALVLLHPEQFDQRRPAFQVDPDERTLPFDIATGVASDDDGMGHDEDGVDTNGADPVAVEGDGLPPQPFAAVEVEPGVWGLVHGDVDVITPVADADHVHNLVTCLNKRCAALNADLSPGDVRACVLAMSQPGGTQPMLVGPYTLEAVEEAAKATDEEPETGKPGRGRVSAAELLLIACDGWDAAASGEPDTSSPYKGVRHVKWLNGYLAQKSGKPRPSAAANDDATSANEAA